MKILIITALFLPIVALANSSSIIISEIAASPSAGFEWVEITNIGSGPIDLSGWKFFEDNTNHKLTAARGGTTLNPGIYAVIAQDANKLLTKYPNLVQVFDSSWTSLKESGEYIALKNSGGAVEEGFNYLAAPSGYLARVHLDQTDYTSANWKELSSPTIDQVNVFETIPPQPASPDTVAVISPAVPFPLLSLTPSDPHPSVVATSTVTLSPVTVASPISGAAPAVISGTVIVPPGTFGVRVAYVESNEQAYEIYSYKGDFPTLHANDVVIVRGELVTSPFLKRIKIKTKNDIQITGQNPVEPQASSLSELDEQDIGRLFVVSGTLLDIRGRQRFFIEGDGKELEVVLKNSTGLSLPRVGEGSQIKLTGVLGYRDGTLIFYPRFPSDLIADTIKKKDQAKDVSMALIPGTTENKTIVSSPRVASPHAVRNIGLTLAFVGLSSMVGLLIRHRDKLFKNKKDG